jgi:macrodomain Ter protein organizer (MatP/YcbG family)
MTNERSIKSCPQCYTAITQNQPFKYIIRRFYEERVQINNNYFGYSYDNKSKQDSINELIAQELINLKENSFEYWISEKLKNELQNLRKQTIGNERKRLLIKSKYQLSIIENKFYIFKALNKVLGQLNSIIPKARPLLFLRLADPINSIIKLLMTHFYKRLESFIFYIGVNYINNLQQISDTKRELNFFFTFCDAIKFVINNQFNEEYLRLLSEAFDSVLNSGPFTNHIKNAFLSKLNTIVETIGLEFKSEDITIEINEWDSPNVRNNLNL